MEIEAPPVEPVSRDASLVARHTGWSINLGAVFVLAVPSWGDAERYRPVGRLLEDRSVPLVHHLVAVVFERLTKRTPHGPTLVAGGAGHAVFSSKSRKRTYFDAGKRRCDERATISKDNREEEKSKPKGRCGPRYPPLY